MKQRAVIDRFADTDLILLVGEEEREIVIPAAQAPQNLQLKEGDWVRLDGSGETMRIIGIDQESTELARRRIQDKLSHLRSRGRSGR